MLKTLSDRVPWDRECALSREACEAMRARVVELRAKYILECGSGVSTAFLAEAAKTVGGGARVYVLEHDPYFAAETAKLLAQLRLSHFVSIILTPIVPRARGRGLWYALPAGRPFSHDRPRWDFVLVDGPPGVIGRLPFLYEIPFFSEAWLDDAERDGEKEMLDRWRQMDGTVEILPFTRPVAKLLPGRATV